jgi:lipoyl(octanoyl) transferase
MARSFTAFWLGRRRYAETYALQLKLFEQRKAGKLGDCVLLLEHDPVITLGRGAKPADVLAESAVLAQRGVEACTTDRGGEVTLHAPGQLVCYPIIGLSPDRCDVRRYVNDLADVMRRLVSPYGVDAGLLPGFVGLWVDRDNVRHWGGAGVAARPEKLGAIGVRISRWVTLHGFALNLALDLDLFRLIVPCGIRQYGVTSLAALGAPVGPIVAWAEPAVRALSDVFGASCRDVVDVSAAATEGLAERLLGNSKIVGSPSGAARLC